MGTLIDTTSIVYRPDLYPRFKPNPSKIQEYAENTKHSFHSLNFYITFLLIVFSVGYKYH